MLAGMSRINFLGPKDVRAIELTQFCTFVLCFLFYFILFIIIIIIILGDRSTLDFEEFKEVTRKEILKAKETQRKKFEEAFDVFDRDGNGKIDAKELRYNHSERCLFACRFI